jgi:transposase-like protein
MIAVACPACHGTAHIVKFGTNRSSSARVRCKACGKTFMLRPNSRALTPDKQEPI